MGASTELQSKWRTISPHVGWSLWLINSLTLIGLCCWILLDGRFSQAASALPGDLERRLAGDLTANGTWPQIFSRVLLLELLVALGFGSAIGIFASLFVGARTHRRIRSWLAFTFLAAAWLSLAVSWRELTWQSQVVRVRWQLSGFESIATSLRSDWPGGDGARDDIGPFMAYPRGSPRTLLLLTTPEIAHARTSISAIERATTGGLRFQLTGSEPDAWLEWHPSRSMPESFRGGLMTEYVLDRSASLGGGWFVVRYR